jgi:predicted transcriptional regulator
MAKPSYTHFSRRERQIMDIIYRHGQATAAEVRQALPDPPSYSTVRALLRVLEEKGHLHHESQGPRYVFGPTLPREQVRRLALKQLVQTFFDGATEQAVVALLDRSAFKLSNAELDHLAQLIEQAKRKVCSS